ncbi:hypothetical protein C1646_760837 [Rhizophagus diaphanus]|nr:hypothetical protein C1646_760837 [Rhizophagus diaphanus] [Rhizophagus sp. MUCL 43196]
MLESFVSPIVKKKNKKKNKKKLRESNLFCLPFEIIHILICLHSTAERGDSGAAVFDDDSKLWGICIAGIPGLVSYYVTPIHLVLEDVKNKFNNVEFTLISKELKESCAD